MSKLTIAGQEVELLPGASITFEVYNQIVDLLRDEPQGGTYSMPFTIPDTPVTRIVFGHANNIDSRQILPGGYPATYENKGFFLKGSFQLREYTPGAGFRGNLITNEKAMVARLKSQKLRNLNLGGNRELGGGPEEILANMRETITDPKGYDYIFAPVYNPGFYSSVPDFGLYDARYINNWQSIYDEMDPTYVPSNFPQKIDYAPGNNPVVTTKQAICPFPYLKYVLTEGLKEIGLTFEDNFFDEELSQLTIICTSTLDNFGTTTVGELKYFGNFYNGQFKLAQLLPNLTMHELLRKLQSTFGLMLTMNLAGKVKLSLAEKTLSNRIRKDITKVFLRDYTRSWDLAGTRLTYRIEGSDSLADEAIKDFSDVTYKGELGYFEQLAQVEMPQPNDCWFIQNLRQYFSYKVFSTNILAGGNAYSWQLYAEDYKDLVTGEGSETFTQGIAATVTMIRHAYDIKIKDAVPGFPELEAISSPEEGELRKVQAVNEYYVYTKIYVLGQEEREPDWVLFAPGQTGFYYQAKTRKWKVPALSMEGYSPPAGQDEISKELRLAFYRGLQPYAGIDGGNYPMLGDDNYNARGYRIGDYSLRWHGEYGLANQFFKSWLKMMNSSKPIRGRINWAEEDLENLDLDQIYTLEGQKAIIKSLKFTLPLKTPPEAELILY